MQFNEFLETSAPDGSRAPSPHAVLRSATREDHALLDELLSRFNFDNPTSYRAFLEVHYDSVSRLAGLGRECDRPGFEALVLALRVDLMMLGGSPVPVPLPGTTADSPTAWHRWGVSYVIRGSRLGAAVLQRRVPPHLPAAYLGSLVHSDWPEFLRLLQEHADSRQAHGAIDLVAGAKMAFGAFLTAARQVG